MLERVRARKGLGAVGYEEIDQIIKVWARRHALKLSTSWAGGECRVAYVSSKAGDCFQFWLDEPQAGQIGVHAAGVDGQWMKEPAKDWFVLIPELNAALEDAFATVIGWMVPSERYFPPGGKP